MIVYQLINKPWEARKLLRAYRLRTRRMALSEAQLIAWASTLRKG